MDKESLRNTLVTSGAFTIVGGIAIYLYQIYMWLRNGEWLRLSLVDFGKVIYESEYNFFGDDFSAWFYYPSDWAGVHTTLNHIPLTLSIIIIGIALIASAFEAME